MAATETVPERPRRRRLTAEARRASILQAARRAFTETGDMNGTTIRVIAAAGGISEGVIYRHFESKDQLFYEAVVQPLRAAIDDLVASSEAVGQVPPRSAEERLEMMTAGYHHLVSTFEELIPLLGLVLFGDPQVAKRFYDETFAAAVDRLAAVWERVSSADGVRLESPDISARAMMGIALVLALESHHNPGFDRDRALQRAGAGTLVGFFPGLEARRKR